MGTTTKYLNYLPSVENSIALLYVVVVDFDYAVIKFESSSRMYINLHNLVTEL